MKKLLSILFFIISINVFAQTKISAPLVRNNSADTGYGSHFDSLGYGGYVTYDNITTRNALPMPQRKYLMQVSVKETDSVYILEGGLTNEYWMPLFKASAGFPVPTWPQTMAVTNGRIFTADNFIHATGHSFVLDSVGGNGFQANYYPNDTDQYSVSVESFTAQLQFSTIHTSGINENHVTEPGVIYSNAAGTGSNSPVSSVDATDTSKVTITAYNNNGGDSISVYPDRVTMSMLNKNAYIGTGYSNCAGCNFLVGDSTTQKVSHITKADVSNLIVGDYLQVTGGKIGLGESAAGTTDPSIRLPGSSTVFNMLKQGTLTQLGNSGILAPKETITAWTTAINLPIVTQSTLLLVANHASPVNDSMFNTNIAGGIAGTFQQNITVPGDPPAKVYDGYGRGKTAAAVVGRIDYNLNDSTTQWFENYHPIYGFYLEPHVTRHGHIQNVNILTMGSVIDNLSDFSVDTVGHTNYGYRSQFPNVSHGGVYWLGKSDQFVIASDSIYTPNLAVSSAGGVDSLVVEEASTGRLKKLDPNYYGTSTAGVFTSGQINYTKTGTYNGALNVYENINIGGAAFISTNQNLLDTVIFPNSTFDYYKNVATLIRGTTSQYRTSVDDINVWRNLFRIRASGKVIYYVSETGNDANAGTSTTTPLKSFNVALAKSDVLFVVSLDGCYGYNERFTGNQTGDVNIILSSNTHIGAFYSMSGWIQDATYSAVKEVTNAQVGNLVKVYDRLSIDEDGNYKEFQIVSSILECSQVQRSYFVSGTTLYVNYQVIPTNDYQNVLMQIDSREVLSGGASSYNMYVEGNGAHFYGTVQARSQGLTGADPTVYLRDIIIVNSSGLYNALWDEGYNMWNYNVKVLHTGSQDALNYHKYLLGNPPQVVDINCSVEYVNQGFLPDATDNATTMHDGGSIITINGYYGAQGIASSVHDVNTSFRFICGAIVSCGIRCTAGIQASIGSTIWAENNIVEGNAIYDFHADNSGSLYLSGNPIKRMVIDAGCTVGTF